MIAPIYKFAHEMEECVNFYKYIKKLKHGQTTPLYYLSKFLDKKKYKRKF